MKKQDPVCGMTVDTESAAARSAHLGTEYFFCSIACQRTFEGHPEQFISDRQIPAGRTSSDEAKRQDNPPFTELDGIVAPMFGSAGSGGLEYDPIPKQPDK
jgi:YHS domain-containing protein